MELFFIKYRKILLAASIFMFLYFSYDVFRGVTFISDGLSGRGIGALVNACVSLFVSIYFFVNVLKANKKYKEEQVPKDEATQNQER